MPSSPPVSTVGSKSFDPSHLFEDRSLLDKIHSQLNQNDLRAAIITAFNLSDSDDYIYHATASVTLAQVQNAVNVGSVHGLHDWYLDSSTKPCGHPPPADISAYISLFDPSKAAANALKGFLANAKKNSLKLGVGQHLTSKRHVSSSAPAVPKRKAHHPDPYLDFWAYACRSLEYAGPNAMTAQVKTSHHVLPVYMHHFGCVCPSYEALGFISLLSKGKTVIDMGSGNGYWTYMLRRENCEVTAVDDGQSKWRTMWIGDTVVADGIKFLKQRGGGNNDVLLLVYPVVSGTFTEQVIKAFRGDAICVAGTQNGNGYTGFKDTVIDEWFDKNMAQWEKIVQIPLPSFPGKDDALFVFQRKDPG
jgi:hypothetical protein